VEEEIEIILNECDSGISFIPESCMRVYPEVSGLAAWSKNCEWYSSLLLGAVVSLFCEPA
jgi:hypothetical protein